VTTVPVIFEDHTLTGFRPLAWSVPVCELRCGLLNLRERLAHVSGHEPVLLVRSLLAELASSGGYRVGGEAAAPPQRIVLLSGRLGARWDLLAELWRTVAAGEDLAWRDDEGWLALTVPAAGVPDVLRSWQRWEAAAAAAGCWHRPDLPVPAWNPPGAGEGRPVAGAWRRLWEIVPATASAIAEDLAHLDGRLPARRIWGAVATADDPSWARPVSLQPWTGADVSRRGEQPLLAGPGCDLAPGVAVDTSAGPVVLGSGVRVLPHSYLEGPLFVGSESLIKAGTTIYGETSLGAVNKVAGEIGESTFLDFSNKQHEGFVGHAYLGSWCNLGALTTNSDLKNTYGTIRVDLGGGAEDSGLRFVGLMMGEHCKTAIGTLFNTGTTVGFASNVFGSGFPDKCLPCFTWGDGRQSTRMDGARALAIAATVMQRRGCRLTPGHESIFRGLAD
jgi:UDP-N-acetylglucosamine diphosphorylase/glucosamine-1-phosphate N-acetyltransferase